jgi:hypothetical protein
MRSLRPLVLRSFRLACIGTLFTLGTAPVSRAAPPPAEAALEEVVRFDEQTRERIYEFAVDERTEAVRLTISARVKSGKVTWILEDPEGGHRLSGRGIRGRIRGDTGEMADPPAGTWRLTLSTERASGWTRFEWSSRPAS